MFTLVDDADFTWLSHWRWLYVGRGYAGRFRKTPAGNRLVYLHRLLLDAGPDQVVDHINGDRLDNRRANLRLVTPSENQQNRALPAHNTSGYKGVCWHKRIGKWHVRIGLNGDRIHLGYYHNLTTAALVYDAAARHYFGEFAHLNFPERLTPPEITARLDAILARRAHAAV